MPVWALRDKAGSVGLPIHHLAARVRTEGRECGVDEAGELQLKGPVVFAGYWRNAEATKAAFTEDGWFRTGDVLSVDADGFFTVRGRLKEMFISGGENVYPAEVEAALLVHPAVRQVAVVGVADERWGEVGRAFIEAAPGEVAESESLRAFLNGRLARYKIPRSFVVGPLPRTASGKIDKKAL
jgi:fatty-acyl-CoA synthase